MADTEGDTTAHAFLWTNGGARDLGTLDGDMVSWGYGINDKGQVVGTSASEPSAGKPLDGFKCPCRAFIWENGQMTNLQRLIPIDSGIRLTQALWINERGQIVTEGWVRPRKDAPPTRRAFLLTPKTQIP